MEKKFEKALVEDLNEVMKKHGVTKAICFYRPPSDPTHSKLEWFILGVGKYEPLDFFESYKRVTFEEKQQDNVVDLRPPVVAPVRE